MRLSELEHWLYANGWVWERTKGSHFHWRHTLTRERITVSVHGSEIAPLQAQRILRDIERTRQAS